MRIGKCIKWLWNISCGFRIPIMVYALTGMLQVGASLFFVFVCKHLIDIATGVSGDNLAIYIGWMVGCLVLQLVLSAVRSCLTSRMEIALRNELHRKLFVHLMESCWSGREQLHTGDMLNRLEEDVQTITDALCRMVPAVFITCFQLLGALYFLSYLDMRLTIVLVFIMPVALLFSKGYIRKMHRLSREIRTTDSEIQSHLQENLQHRILLRTLEYTSQSVHKLDAVQSVLQDKVKQRTDFSVFSRSMVQVGFMTGYAVAFLWGVFGLREGTVTFGMMAAFLQLVSQIQRPMVDLSRQIPAAIRVLTSAERLIELTDLPLEERGESVRLEGNLGIRMHGVS